jgi:hypothetical protein
MHCHFCGHPLTAEMRSCPLCGTKIMTSRRTVQETPAARTMPPQVRPVYRLIEQDVAARQERRVWMVLLLSLLMLSLLALLLLWSIK